MFRMDPEHQRVPAHLGGIWPPISEAVGDRPPRIAAFLSLLVATALAPYPYGGITPAMESKIEVLAFLTGVLAFASRASIPRAVRVPALCGVGVAALGLVQVLPLSRGSLARLAPLSLATWAEANAVLGRFGEAAPAPRVSLAPWETEGTIVLVAAFVVLFLAAASILDSRPKRRVFLGVLLAGGFAQVIHGVSTEAHGERRLHGTFINPNHLAGYLEISLAVALALVWLALRKPPRSPRSADRGDRIEAQALPVAGAVLAWSVLVAGLGLTRSRGALLAVLVTTLAVILIAAARSFSDWRPRAALALGLAVLSGGVVSALGTGDRPVLRFIEADTADLGRDGRIALWRGSLELVPGSPVVGYGLGAFPEAFRRVQTADLVGMALQAHNEALQILVTGGAIGLALFLVGLGALLASLVRGFLEEGHREEAAVLLAGAAALVSLLLHGLVEFNFSLPAIPATLAPLLGAALAAGDVRVRETRRVGPIAV